MKKLLALPLMAATLALASCFGEEPLNTECDIEKASIHVDDVEAVFYNEFDSTKVVLYDADSIGFFVRPRAEVGSVPLHLHVTPGAIIFRIDNNLELPFVNGSNVDFSTEAPHYFRVYSEDRMWHRDYKICVVHDIDPTFGHKFFRFDFNSNYALYDPSKPVDAKGNYFVWTETDSMIVADFFGSESWKCGNPGFKLSKSSAKPLDYPSIPAYGEGPDGTDCVKLETKDTGAFGNMVDMRIASGSLFSGYFDVTNALKNARKATQFGLPFKHKPSVFRVWLKCEIGEKFQDKAGKPVEGVIDEPDAYVVVYRNRDEQGGQVLLDGDDVLSSPYIVGMARLAHNYTADGRDQIGNNPIHGVTSEWQLFELPVVYTEELDQDILANNGYSMIIGFASSWQGAYFTGAIGTKLWIDNIEIECEY